MEIILCPYCECKVDMNDVDDEGGVCPECGALITGSILFDQEDELEEEEGAHPRRHDGDDDDEFEDES
ncbi:MAG: hypothetical protein WC789_01550 [Lentisphaeria bacterium]|jgi:transcription initiation factor TFIIIB Brf1 subunit/transcription initiation factor TFIIB